MIKEVEYEDENNWLKGSIEITKRIENGKNVFTIKSFVEDKLYGMPWENVPEENWENIASLSEKGIKKELKRRADQNNSLTLEGRMRKKGFSEF